MLGLLSTSIYLDLSNEDPNVRADMGLHKDIGEALYIISSALIGMYAHRDELFDFSDGLTKEHIHALLGLTALGFMASNQDYLFNDHKDSGLLAGSFAFMAYSFTLF